MDALRFYRGGVLFRVLIKLGFRKRAKRKKGGSFMTTSRRRSDEGDEDDEEEERKEEKDDFPGDDKRVRSFCVNYCGVSRREEMR